MKYFATALVIALPMGVFSWVYWGPSTIDLSSESSLIRPNFGAPKKVTATKQQKPVQPVLSKKTVSTPLQETDPMAKLPAEPATDQISSLFIADCNCQLPGSEPRAITYEDEKECGTDRNYLTASLKKLPESMREVREFMPEAQVGRECIALVMRSFLSSGQKFKSQSFAKCKNSKARPERGVKIHCMTEPYVNTVYNSLVDVSDCLNIPQADLIAKLSNESGLHMNTFGSKGDTGIGQLTGSAIDAILEPYWLAGGRITVREYFIENMQNSTKDSCRRVMQNPSAYEKVTSVVGQRCNLINTPENPLRNLLYTGMYYRILKDHVAGIKYVNGNDIISNTDGLTPLPEDKDFKPGGLIEKFEIRKNLIALGIKNPDMHAVERAIVMLGYNAGPAKAAEYFSVYLKKRLQNKKWLNETDVDFLSTDFMKTWQKMVGGMAKTASSQSPALAKARKTAHTKSLPEFLMIIQNSGSPGYLSKVALKHKELLEQMGDERCVSPNFIHF